MLQIPERGNRRTDVYVTEVELTVLTKNYGFGPPTNLCVCSLNCTSAGSLFSNWNHSRIFQQRKKGIFITILKDALSSLHAKAAEGTTGTKNADYYYDKETFCLETAATRDDQKNDLVVTGHLPTGWTDPVILAKQDSNRGRGQLETASIVQNHAYKQECAKYLSSFFFQNRHIIHAS